MPPEALELNLDLSGSPSGPRAFGPFKVLHQIGIGVLGPVYRAQDREHFVAIKAFRLDIPPETADDLGEALRALVSAATGIDGLVLPVGAGVEGGTPWLAMPHVALPTLDTRLRDEGAPDLDRAARILRALAAAVDAAHARDLLHGSLHPRDVFVDANGGVLVTGFGVARALQSVGVRPPVRRPYTAPELIADPSAPLVHAPPADHYSLGAMAFELLTGHRLLSTGTDLASRLYRADGTGVDASATALSAMLALRPEHRPARAFAFAQAVSQAIGSERGRSGVTSLPPAGTAPPSAADDAASDEALRLFAKQGTLWHAATEPVREDWREVIPVAPAGVPTEDREDEEAADEPLAVAPPALKPPKWDPPTVVLTPMPTPPPRLPDPSSLGLRGSAPPLEIPAPVAVEPAPRMIAPPVAAPVEPRGMTFDPPDDPPSAPAGVLVEEAATGSPPAVVLALVLALGLAIGGAGGYLLGQHSGRRAALRATGGETALAEQPTEASEAPPEPAPPESAPPVAAPPDSPSPATAEATAPAPVRERPAPRQRANRRALVAQSRRRHRQR